MFWFGKAKRDVLWRLAELEQEVDVHYTRLEAASLARSKIRKRIYELKKAHAVMRQDQAED